MLKMLEEAVLHGNKGSIRTLVEGKIRRKIPQRKLFSVNESRVYSFNYFKNKIGHDFYSYPWGFRTKKQ